MGRIREDFSIPNGLNLWIVSVGLAGHAVTLVTLPLALAATLAALQERTPQAALLAGLIVAAMLLSFYSGALPLYGSAVAGLGLVHLLRGPHRIEVRKPGYKTLTLDVRIEPDRRVTYRGDLRPQRP